MKMTNLEIYNYAKNITEAFRDFQDYIPVKVNFYIQKNKTTLTTLAQQIEQARMEIIRNAGILNEENGQYTIPDEKMSQVQQELVDLFDLEQEVDIYKISIDSFPEELTLTTRQMEALMFMIE